ncbi:hypothetical protein [Bacillus sp. SA1-12]|nr:hypothetical protein [Bacillus sp. SA1-12]
MEKENNHIKDSKEINQIYEIKTNGSDELKEIIRETTEGTSKDNNI